MCLLDHTQIGVFFLCVCMHAEEQKWELAKQITLQLAFITKQYIFWTETACKFF